jgi:perosamine synthetase
MIEVSLNVPLVAPYVGDEEIAAVTAVLRSGQLASGPQTVAFESEFAVVAGTAYAVAVNSGTAANHAGLEAFGVGDGDEVVTTPFTFAATATPILMQRAVPRFVDIDPRTFNLDPAAALAAATSKTKAAVVVDLFGLPVDPAGVPALRERNIRLFEDACQAIGARRDGRIAGSIGEAASFSFYATKNLMTGEGGMLSTDDAAIVASARRFRQHGMGAQYEYLSLGYNYRMTDIAAAIGRVQLGRLAEISRARRANAAFYDAELANIPGLVTPYVPPGATHAYHQYSIRRRARVLGQTGNRERNLLSDAAPPPPALRSLRLRSGRLSRLRAGREANRGAADPSVLTLGATRTRGALASRGRRRFGGLTCRRPYESESSDSGRSGVTMPGT